MKLSLDRTLTCPYCNRHLRWVPLRWFGRGCFECEQCGDFPDLSDASRTDRFAPGQFAAPAGHAPRRPADRPRVLLVDDSAEHCDLYALMLEPTASVITAARGEDAMTIACGEPIDEIELDVLMPGMDGWEVCRRLKENPLTSPVPVIMLTSLEGRDVVARAQTAGAAAVLMKPCPAERLALAIEGAVQKPPAPPTRTPDPAYTRRWTRIRVARELEVLVTAKPGEVDVNLVNVSYGGLCLQVPAAIGAVPLSFAVSLPASALSIQAEAVWTVRGRGGWVCGAEVADAGASWRGVVDHLSRP